MGNPAPDVMRAVSDGTQLGKYQLLRRLATGGMAELFLARAVAMAGFEKFVVLKRILPQHAESDDFIKMFLTEARLAATLHHPNIVQVYDIGEEGGHYFFTMEWVRGQDLRRIVRAARKASMPIPLEHVLHIIAGVAAGLNHAHEKADTDGTPIGIVHRDVSPSNVLVTYDGAVKLVDFGIAKAAAFQSNTVAGTLKGKIPYMSPEQCRGEVVDRRSDIFSIGTLLWEMTTGSRLFAGDNEIAIINRVARGDVPTPTSIRPDYPPELEAIVMRALHSDPELRYQQAVDLQIDLEDFAREHRLPVSSARMAKFMRELFADEIQLAAAQLSAEHIDRSDGVAAGASGPQSIVPVRAADVSRLAGGTTQTVVDPADIEIPSEILGRTPTPRVESEISRNSVTRSEVAADSGPDDSLIMGRRTPWRAIAAASVMLAVGGWAFVAMLPTSPADVGAGVTPAVIRPAEAAPAHSVDLAPKGLSPSTAVVPPPEIRPASTAVTKEQDDEIVLLPSGGVDARPGGEEVAPPAPTPRVTKPNSTPTPGGGSATKPAIKRPPSDKKPDAKKPPSDTVKKPKWDPDNPMPPA